MNWTKLGTPIEVNGMRLTPEIEIEISFLNPGVEGGYVWVEVRPVSIHIESQTGVEEIMVPNVDEA